MTSWMAITPEYVAAEVVFPADTENDVWSDEGPGETPALVIGNGGDDAVVFEGTLDEIGETVRRINRAYYAALDTARTAAPAEPGVTLDEEWLFRWMERPVFHGGPSGYTNAVHHAIPPRFDNVNHHIGELVDVVLADLLTEEKGSSRNPLRIASDVETVRADALLDQEPNGGGLAVYVQMRGDVDAPPFDLTVGHFTWQQLLAGAPAEAHGNDGVIRMTGVGAVDLAISNLVGPINEVVTKWRERTRPLYKREGLAATLNESEIECALRTLAELHELGDNADLSERQRKVMFDLGLAWIAEMFGDDEDDTAGEPQTCILTGQDGENPDDCTTHEHDAPAATLVWEPAGTDKPGDQKATSAHTPDGCTGAYYQVGPQGTDGDYSLVLITVGPGGVGELLLGVYTDADGAKLAAQEREDSDA